MFSIYCYHNTININYKYFQVFIEYCGDYQTMKISKYFTCVFLACNYYIWLQSATKRILSKYKIGFFYQHNKQIGINRKSRYLSERYFLYSIPLLHNYIKRATLTFIIRNILHGITQKKSLVEFIYWFHLVEAASDRHTD